MGSEIFSALVVDEEQPGHFVRAIRSRNLDDLPKGEVLIRVRYSSLNYKDALSASGNRGVTRHYPHTPGIDAAGSVAHSGDSRWQEGEEVICTGYDLGMNTDGGFGQYIRVPGDWVVRKPEGLTLFECMQLGTAGFTAGLCMLAFERCGLSPEKGPVLVSGATGGVGSIAVQLLSSQGYSVVAVTGKEKEHGFLRELGADRVLDRSELTAEAHKLLLPAQWAGVVDTVGGEVLAAAVKGCRFDGVVTCCGNAGSAELPLNVYPFILRGVQLLGIYSANCPMDKRLMVWRKLATEWKLKTLAAVTQTIVLTQLEAAMEDMLKGRTKGRYVVDLEDKR